MGTVINLAQVREERRHQKIEDTGKEAIDTLENMYSTAIVGSPDWFASAALLEALDWVYNALPFEQLREYLHVEFEVKDPISRVGFSTNRRDPAVEFCYVTVTYWKPGERTVPAATSSIDPKHANSVMNILGESLSQYNPSKPELLSPVFIMARELAYQGFLQYKVCETPVSVQLTLYNDTPEGLYQADLVIGVKALASVALDFE